MVEPENETSTDTDSVIVQPLDAGPISLDVVERLVSFSQAGHRQRLNSHKDPSTACRISEFYQLFVITEVKCCFRNPSHLKRSESLEQMPSVLTIGNDIVDPKHQVVRATRQDVSHHI